MNNKKAADPRAIVLIFAVLAMALAIIIFYIWIGVSGVAKQQNSIDGNVVFLALETYLTNEITQNPEIFDGSVETIRANLQKVLTEKYEVGSITCNKKIGAPPIVDCTFKIKSKKDSKQCHPDFNTYFYLPQSTYNNGRYSALPPQKIYLFAEVCV